MADVAPPKSVARGKTRRLRGAKGLPGEGASDIDRMKYFYQMRARDPTHYTYTPEGNLRIEGIQNTPTTTIPLRPFSALQPEERQALEDKRVEDLMEIEGAYEESLLALRDAVAKYRERGHLMEDAVAVVRANEEVRLNSVLRSNFAYPSKWIQDIDNPSVSDILLRQRYETRKMGYDVFVFKRQDLSLQDAFGHYRERIATEAPMEGGGNTNVLFLTDADNEETGMFHPASIHEFVFAETRYASPYQAFEGERFKEIGNESIRKQILGTRSARTIRNLVEKEETAVVDPQKQWEAILGALFTQHKDLAKTLKETGSAKFHSMDKEMVSQAFVDALETVRTRLRETDEDAEKAPEVAKESVITEDEQKKAKKAAIIHNFQRRGGRF